MECSFVNGCIDSSNRFTFYRIVSCGICNRIHLNISTLFEYMLIGCWLLNFGWIDVRAACFLAFISSIIDSARPI